MNEPAPIFDVHHHHLGMNPIGLEHRKASLDKIAARHVEVMDLNGITGAALLPPPVSLNPEGLSDTREPNDEVATLHERFPERFPVGIGTVEPSYRAKGLGEIDRVLGELNLQGVM